MNILLVEDENGLGRLICRTLRRRGCEVHWERIGKNVPQLASSGRFNTVILDLLLPDSDGLDICREIRAAEVGVPILIVTARSHLDDRIDGFAAGADGYLAKPFSFRELLARLNVLAVRDRSRKPDPIKIGGLRVDPDARCATWNGQPIEVAGRPFALLLALARARGDIVGRDSLIEEIWGTEADITVNSLDVCVSSLRRGLASVTADVRVRAMRGHGFALDITGSSAD